MAGVVAVFGGSPVQITGPTGAMAVVLVGIVAKYGSEKVWTAGVMAGIIQIAIGVAKLGCLVKFIPYPVTAGFTNVIAVIIFCGQLQQLPIKRTTRYFLKVLRINTFKKRLGLGLSAKRCK